QLGRNIYLWFDAVVKLQQQIHITDAVWHNILQHARTGACTSVDFSEIQQLVLTNKEFLITPHNSVQSRWNIRATEKHCLLTGEILYICPAEDSTHDTPLQLHND
ncbi:uncharacterized protein BJ212DRAFT_1276698, partial [Suillus subaureus]